MVAEAFRKTLSAVVSGGGPSFAFGPYLAMAIRSVVADQGGVAAVPLPDEEAIPPVPEPDADAPIADPGLFAAFCSLPDRWQTVLWMMDVEGQSPHVISDALQLSSANAASALCARARSGLRLAYLSEVVSQSHSRELRRFLKDAAGRSSADLEAAVRWHLERCSECAAERHRMAALPNNSAALIAPAIAVLVETQAAASSAIGVGSAVSSAPGSVSRWLRRTGGAQGVATTAVAVAAVGLAVTGGLALARSLDRSVSADVSVGTVDEVPGAGASIGVGGPRSAASPNRDAPNRDVPNPDVEVEEAVESQEPTPSEPVMIRPSLIWVQPTSSVLRLPPGFADPSDGGGNGLAPTTTTTTVPPTTTVPATTTVPPTTTTVPVTTTVPPTTTTVPPTTTVPATTTVPPTTTTVPPTTTTVPVTTTTVPATTTVPPIPTTVPHTTVPVIPLVQNPAP